MLKKFIKITVGCVVLLVTTAVLLLLLQPRISLGVLSGPFSSLLSSLTGNEHVISGRYYGFVGRWFKPDSEMAGSFSLATPIQISGPLSDLGAGMATGGGVGTLIRLATEFIAVPLQWIVLGKLPEDGTADCLQLMEPKKQTENPSGHDWYSSP